MEFTGIKMKHLSVLCHLLLAATLTLLLTCCASGNNQPVPAARQQISGGRTVEVVPVAYQQISIPFPGHMSRSTAGAGASRYKLASSYEPALSSPEPALVSNGDGSITLTAPVGSLAYATYAFGGIGTDEIPVRIRVNADEAAQFWTGTTDYEGESWNWQQPVYSAGEWTTVISQGASAVSDSGILHLTLVVHDGGGSSSVAVIEACQLETSGGTGGVGDADLLDGIASSQFLRNDQAGTLFSDLAVAGNLEIAGNVGIGKVPSDQALDVQGAIRAAAVITPHIKASSDNSVSTVDFDSLPGNAQHSGITIGKTQAIAGNNNGQPYLWLRANGAHSWILDYTNPGINWAQSMGAYYLSEKQGNLGFVGVGPTVDYLSIGFNGYAWWNEESKFIIWQTGRAEFMPQQTGGFRLDQPAAWLVLASGSSEPQSAPLKFKPGGLLSNPEPGAMEWDGDRLYITNSSATRQTISYGSGGIGGFNAGRIPFAGLDGELTDDPGLRWDNDNQRLGVGVEPEATLHISGQDLNLVDRYTDFWGYGAGLALRRSRGSAESPAAVQSGDLLGSINYRGYNGTGFSGTAAAVFGFAADDWSGSQQGSYLTFVTTAAGDTAIAERMRITDAGDVGIGVSDPSATLHVQGQLDQVQSKVQGQASQSEDLTQWLSAGGSVLANVDSAGVIQAAGYESMDGTAGATGSQVVVTDITQDPVTKDITVTTKTIHYKNGLITSVE